MLITSYRFVHFHPRIGWFIKRQRTSWCAITITWTLTGRPTYRSGSSVRIQLNYSWFTSVSAHRDTLFHISLIHYNHSDAHGASGLAVASVLYNLLFTRSRVLDWLDWIGFTSSLLTHLHRFKLLIHVDVSRIEFSTPFFTSSKHHSQSCNRTRMDTVTKLDTQVLSAIRFTPRGFHSAQTQCHHSTDYTPQKQNGNQHRAQMQSNTSDYHIICSLTLINPIGHWFCRG